MASFFKNILVSEIGTTPVDILTTVEGSVRSTVIGLSLTNLTDGMVLASIQVDDTVTSVYYIKDVILPPNQSLRVINGGEKLILQANTTITVTSNTDASLDLIMSYVEIV